MKRILFYLFILFSSANTLATEDCAQKFSQKYTINHLYEKSSDFGTVFFVSEKNNPSEEFAVKMTPVINDKLASFYSNANQTIKYMLQSKYKIQKKSVTYGRFKDIHGHEQNIAEDELFIARKLSDMVKDHKALNFPEIHDYFISNFIPREERGAVSIVQKPIQEFPDMQWHYLVVKKHKIWSSILKDKESVDLFHQNENLLLFSLRFSLSKSWEALGFVHGDIYNGTENNLFYELRKINQKYVVFKNEGQYYIFDIKGGRLPLLILFDFSFADLAKFNKFKKVPMRSVDEFPIGASQSTQEKRKTDIMGINQVLKQILGHSNLIPQVALEQNQDLIRKFPSHPLTESEYQEWRKEVHKDSILFIH